MALSASSHPRITVDGKFFRLGGRKFYVKGLCYGPFAPNAAGQPFASPEQTAADLARIQSAGANLIRVYHVPAKWFLDLALEHELKVLVDIPWNEYVCFLDSKIHRDRARDALRRGVLAAHRHPAIFAFNVAHEIPPDIVRWSGAARVADFIDELAAEARRLDPDCLCTFTNYPPTEFLRPQTLDFISFNLYLHHEAAFRSYLARLQMLADSKPLLLSELGIDSARQGEQRKCEMLRWQIEDGFCGGVAGLVVFSFSDDWWRNGQPVEDWFMGLTTRDREPKPSWEVVRKAFAAAPYFRPPRSPKVSVVVAAYNAERTLPNCLDSLQRLNYPDYEVILVDDGSTDSTAQIASRYPQIRYLRHPGNLGLSAARNTGIAAAAGELLAFTDADCRADEDWLHYLVADLVNSDFAGVGGPNLLPPEDSPTAAAVMAAPGGPAHVMLTDRQAEHIPGCNMAFFKWVLAEVGGFDPIFQQAGDDVDLCWRIQQAGYKIGFSPGAFVWHYRRSTVRDYLKQQHGYGAAEALLLRKHPESFNAFGGGIWRGRIYAPAHHGLLLRRPVIYRGLFATAGFQSLYAAEPAHTLMLCTTLEYHVLVTVPLWILSSLFPGLLPLAFASLLFSLSICAAAGAQADLPKNKLRDWSRPLVGFLFFLQPIVRGWARYQGRLLERLTPLAARESLDSVAIRRSNQSLHEVAYQGGAPVKRVAFVADLLRRLDQEGWPNKSDIGWCDYDVEITGSRWTHLQLVTVAEDPSYLLRCRLRPRWSLAAKVGFWGMVGAEILILGLLARSHHLLWLILLTLPLVAWFIRREQRMVQSLTLVLLDELARAWGLKRVHANGPAKTQTQDAGQAPASADIVKLPKRVAPPDNPSELRA